MIFEIMILAFIIGMLKGGSVLRLERLKIKGLRILMFSFVLEILSLFIITNTNNQMAKIIEGYFLYIHILTYFLLIVVLFMNYRERGLKITLFGSILNFLPIIYNHGKMPVSIKALKNAELYNKLNLLYDDRIMTHKLVSKNTKLNFLGDIIPIPKPYPFPKIISIGDILISTGIFILIYTYMIRKEGNKNPYINTFKP